MNYDKYQRYEGFEETLDSLENDPRIKELQEKIQKTLDAQPDHVTFEEAKEQVRKKYESKMGN